MNDKRKSGGGAALAFALLGLLAFIGLTGWAIFGVYLEVETSRRISRSRSERVLRQIQEREHDNATQQLPTSPASETP